MPSFTPTYDESSISVMLATVGGGNMSPGSPNLTTVGFNPLPDHPAAQYFSPGDVGTAIVLVLGAGPSGSNLLAKILAYVDTQNVVLDANASTTVTNGESNVLVFRKVDWLANSLTYEEQITSNPQGSFDLDVPSGSYPPIEGQPFLFLSSDPSVATETYGAFFGGELDTVEVNNHPGSADIPSRATCSCVSYKAICGRRVMQGAKYGAMSLLAVAQAIVASGLTADHVDLVCPTGPTVTELDVNDLSYVGDALDNLMGVVNIGADTYDWRTDSYRRIVVYVQEVIAAPFSISDSGGTDGNIFIPAKATRTRDRFANEVYTKADKGLGDVITQNITNPLSVGVYRALTLQNKAGVPPSLKVGGVSKVVWISPVDVRTDSTPVTIPVGYDWAWPINSDYLFTDGGRPGVNPHVTAEIKYQVSAPATGLYTDVASVDARSAVEGGSGLHQSVVSVDNPIGRSQLDAVTESTTKSHSSISKSIEGDVIRPGLKLAMSLVIHLSDINANDTFLVESVKLSIKNSWPVWSIKATVGSTIGDWVTRLGGAFGGGGGSAGGGGIIGSSGSSVTAPGGFVTAVPDGANHVTLDVSLGTNFKLVLGAIAVTVLAPLSALGSIPLGTRIVLYLEQDATGGRSAPTYTSGAGAFAVDPDLAQLSGDPSSRTMQQFFFDGNGWSLDMFKEGIVKP